MLVACRLAGLFALGACYAVVGARAVRADAAPPTQHPAAPCPEPCASRRPDRARFFQHPRAPPSARSPAHQKARSRATAAERRNGRGPTNGNNDIEPPSTSISYMFIIVRSGHIFN